MPRNPNRRSIGAGLEVSQFNSSSSSGMLVSGPVCNPVCQLDVEMYTAWNALVSNAQCWSTTTASNITWETGYAACFREETAITRVAASCVHCQNLPLLVQAPCLLAIDDQGGRALQRLEQPGVWPINFRLMHDVA